MIITRTPLRISFAGGGTDLPDFCEKHSGAVLSTAIDKYIYVTVKQHNEIFGEKYRLNYSETEHVDHLDQIKNAIARECIRLLKVGPPLYISTVADLPAYSGLGSSGSFAVGLLNALHAMKNERVSAGQLAEEASKIEIEILKRPIGRQDQYAAAFGGLNFISFNPDGRVSIEPQNLADGKIDVLFKHILMFWTGMIRDSSSVLAEQKNNIGSRIEYLKAMKHHASELRDMIQKDFSIESFSMLLDQSWQLKRKLASGITNDQIEDWYKKGIEAGAMGGKLCGAGGGGFLLFIVEPNKQDRVRSALPNLVEVQVHYESQGSHLKLID